MKFRIGSAENLKLADNEITAILRESYLNENHVDADRFETSFSPQKIRARGEIYCAREIASNEIAAMVIRVEHASAAKLFAQPGEVEMHLLGVKPKFQKNGLGGDLIKYFLDSLKNKGYSKLLLCTQVNMYAAHKLYGSFGFVRNPSRDFRRGDRSFLFFEKYL